jgi:hypothetical protein
MHEISDLAAIVIRRVVTYRRDADEGLSNNNNNNNNKKTPGPQSASELYRQSDRRLSAKLVPTLAD